MNTHPRPDSTHDALAGCGARLRSAREAAGLSVDDVASRLRMPARVVRSLEAEDWSRLGAPVFVRGQVRSYSRLLGLGTTTMMQALDVDPVEPTPLVSRTHIPRAQWLAEQLGRRLVYIVLTASLAIPAWVATQQHLAGMPEGVAALDTAPRAPATATGTDPVSRPSRTTVVASLAPVPAVSQAAASPAAITLSAHARSWFEVLGVDGVVLGSGMLEAGTERRFERAAVQRITVGNAAAVSIDNAGAAVDPLRTARANVARFTVSSDGSLAAGD